MRSKYVTDMSVYLAFQKPTDANVTLSLSKIQAAETLVG